METPGERATRAVAAWGLAKRRGDEPLRAAALAAYRDARRDERATVVLADYRKAMLKVRADAAPITLRQLDRIRRDLRYRSDWA
jgi:hypothetical protein